MEGTDWHGEVSYDDMKDGLFWLFEERNDDYKYAMMA